MPQPEVTATPQPASADAQDATPQADATAKPETAATPPEADATGTDKPFLGDAGAAAGSPAKPDAPKPAAPTDEDYLKAVQKDEAVLGKDDNLVFDQNLIKAVIPVCQKHGISTAAANELANAFAKAQIEGAREMMKERSARFARMNDEARAKYSDADFRQINAGIDSCFKPGGVMNNVIRNSELGADPEFLALMHRLGAESKTDTGAGTAAGAGAASGDPNSTEGLSKLW